MSPQHPHLQAFFNQQFSCIAGPCVIESESLCVELAHCLKEICTALKVPYIFKASFDKANRTSHHSFRGHGIDEGLRILQKIKQLLDIPILTDIHLPQQAAIVAEVVDVLQIPAFLCRQTDLIEAAARTGKAVNIKKGQFVAPEDMVHSVAKFENAGGKDLMLTERGSCFGYHDLVVDFRSLAIMKARCQRPIVFDATHCVQRPSAGTLQSQGNKEFIAPLARAAAAVGIEGLFCEVHFTPEQALSDAATSITPQAFQQILKDVLAIQSACQNKH